MIRSQPQVKRERVRAPVRRVLALDSGSRSLKLLLAESDFGRFRVLRRERIDLQAEGLVSAEEVRQHLEGVLIEWGSPPLALSLPQHVSISQIIDVPLASENEVEKFIGEETLKLSGVAESRIVYDFVSTGQTSQSRKQFWVTQCQEGDIRERILRLGLEQEDLCEVTTTANALFAAYQATAPDSQRAILVHMGAQTTVVGVLLDGLGVFATSFQMGGDFLTRALARVLNSSPEAAEHSKQQQDHLHGEGVSSDFTAAVDGWVSELKRQLNEWFQANPALVKEVTSFRLVASGGGFEQPGLLNYLQTSASLTFQAWPREKSEFELPEGYEVAMGTALQALGFSPQPVSLLPDDFRIAWRKRMSRQRIEWASLALIAVCTVVLGLGTWHKLSLIKVKEQLLEKVTAGQRAFDENTALTEDLVAEYENLRPLCALRQNTIDTLKTISLLQQSRTNRNCWYILLADPQSYFAFPSAMLSTNRPAKTNLIGAALDASQAAPLGFRSAATAFTNAAPFKPGLIAELCIPGDAEAARESLRELVNGLKQQLLFSKVDLLSDDLRRSLSDSKVTVTDRCFALSLDFAQTDFQQPIRARRSPASGPPRTRQRANRQAWPPGDNGPGAVQTMP
jgi:Tfp pilus assembly PilM family ATPase